MADFSALKTSIQNYIKQNGNEEITGNLLQQILLSMVSTLGDSAINDLVTALNAEIANRANADTELGGRITTLQGVVNGIKTNVENGYVYAGIATPSTTPVSGKVFYLALTAGTYTNFGATIVPQGINILKYNGTAWSLDSFLGLDDAPTQGSGHLVKSGGVLDSIIKDGSAFDLSAYNNGTTYADLSAALTALNALPAAYKKGGMSFKYVQTSDNKYVQYRLMAQNFTTDITQWQGVDDEPTLYSNNLITSDAVARKVSGVETEITLDQTDQADKILTIYGVETLAGFYCLIGSANVSGLKKVKICGYQWGVETYPLYGFFDSNNQMISTGRGPNNDAVVDYEVDVPSNAVTMYVNGLANDPANFYTKTIETSFENCFDKYYEEKPTINSSTTTIPDIYQHSGHFMGVLGLVQDSAGSFYSNRISFTKGTRIKIQHRGTSPYVSILSKWTSNGVFIRDLIYGVDTLEWQYEEYVVHDDVEYLVFSGRQNEPSISLFSAEVLIINTPQTVIDAIASVVMPYNKLNFIALGDSITALGETPQGWVRYFMDKTGCGLIANVAVSGAFLKDYSDTGAYDGNPTEDNHLNVLGNQVQKILNNNYAAPDFIVIAVGTNDGINITKADMHNAYFNADNTYKSLNDVDRTTSAGAYRWCLEKLHNKYPNALIMWCAPILGYWQIRPAEEVVSWYESLKIATDYTGRILIDSIHCGISTFTENYQANGEYLQDGLHPNANGAKLLGYFNASRIIPYLKQLV